MTFGPPLGCVRTLPAGNITGHGYTNDAVYRWTPGVDDLVADTHNGLNQVITTDGTSVTHDARGNLTAAGSDTYGYDALNRLTSAATGSVTTTLSYDPAGRLREVAATGQTTTRFLYAGSKLVAEYDTSGNVLRRYVHGPGTDQPLMWYEGSGSGTSTRNWLYANYQGSIIAVADNSGSATETYTYDPYGTPSATTGVRFKYTGQIYLATAGLYHYKARAYSSTLGRFLQTDPIGYGDGLNMYAYVGGDPVNGRDPSGLCGTGIWFQHEAIECPAGGGNWEEILVTPPPPIKKPPVGSFSGVKVYSGAPASIPVSKPIGIGGGRPSNNSDKPDSEDDREKPCKNNPIDCITVTAGTAPSILDAIDYLIPPEFSPTPNPDIWFNNYNGKSDFSDRGKDRQCQAYRDSVAARNRTIFQLALAGVPSGARGIGGIPYPRVRSFGSRFFGVVNPILYIAGSSLALQRLADQGPPAGCE